MNDFCFRCGAELQRGVARCSTCGAIVRFESGGSSHSLFRLIGYVAVTLLFLLVLAFAWGQAQSSTSAAQHNTDVQVQQWAGMTP